MVVVESAAHGGSLITAEMAGGYSREVMAFPGRTTDIASAGCNQLIRRNAAHLITCAQDLIDDLGWESLQQPDGQGTMDWGENAKCIVHSTEVHSTEVHSDTCNSEKPESQHSPCTMHSSAMHSNESTILTALRSGGGELSLSDLIAKTAMPMSQLAPLLLTLEMQGTIKKLAGNKYHLK